MIARQMGEAGRPARLLGVSGRDGGNLRTGNERGGREGGREGLGEFLPTVRGSARDLGRPGSGPAGASRRSGTLCPQAPDLGGIDPSRGRKLAAAGGATLPGRGAWRAAASDCSRATPAVAHGGGRAEHSAGQLGHKPRTGAGARSMQRGRVWGTSILMSPRV